jgi:2-polyprenyl-3-methyl-5-hydroxy-6-metoxy-1,4-benzoquinol methylase
LIIEIFIGEADIVTSAPSLSEQRDFYARFWRDSALQLHAAEIERLGEIYRAIAVIRAESKGTWSICDLGCGTGWLSHEMLKFGNVTGVDLSPDGIGLAKTRWPGATFETQDVLRWRPQTRFDLVVSSEVIEHVPDHKAFIETVNAILKPGGHLIMTTPNLRLKKWWDKADAGQQAIEHWLSPAQLRHLLNGYEILRHETFMFDYLYVGPYRVLSAPKLLAALRWARLNHIYDAMRRSLDLGLYQICFARRRTH